MNTTRPKHTNRPTQTEQTGTAMTHGVGAERDRLMATASQEGE